MQTLKLGDQGPVVRRLQVLLSDVVRLVPALTLDGSFGPQTRDAVRRFQRDRGLTADGVVGPATWMVLGQIHLHDAPEPMSRPQTRSATPWMDIAIAELGVHENALPGQQNQRILEYHRTTTLRASTDETPWCSSFVNWVMTKATYRGTNSAAARSWLRWGNGLVAPREGAITVIRRRNAGSDAATGSATGYHVAFLVFMTPDSIRLLGGNQSDQVKYSTFSLESYDVKGHRWPA